MRKWDKWLWFFIRIFTNFVSTTFFVVFSFLLWEQEGSITTLLQFNFFTFLAILIGLILTGEILVFISLKRLFILGLVSRIVLVSFLYLNIDSISDYIIPASIIYGLSSSFFWNSDGLLGQELVGENKLINFFSLLEIAFSLLSIITPFFINYTFSNLSVEGYLLLVAGLMTFGIILTLPLKNVKPLNNNSILDAFSEIKEQKAVRDLALVNIAVGVGGAFSLGIIDVIILDKLGTLENWTYFAFILAMAGVFVSSNIAKIKPSEGGKLRFLISFGLLSYAAIPILLYSYFNLYVLIGFIFVKVFYDKIVSSALIPYTIHIQSQDSAFKEKKVDYTVFSNVFWVIGNLIPIAILILIPEEYMSVDILLYLLVLITFVPLYFASKLKTRYRNYFDSE